MTIPYRRILLKVSGESLMGDDDSSIARTGTARLAQAIESVRELGVQVAVVTGGGNIFRGVQRGAVGARRTPADQMGMLATIINGIAIQEALDDAGIPSHVLSALPCPQVVETYSWHQAMELLDAGQVVVFVGGTGHPYFTTDTTAALRACEIGADLLVKATQVDGVYDKDPNKHKGATRFPRLTARQALEQKLQVMDATAFALCMDNQVPILVCNIFGEHTLGALLKEHKHGTLVTPK